MRRRRTKYQWFQPLGLIGPAADESDSLSGRNWELIVPNNGTTASIVLPILPDFQSDDLPDGGPMGLIQNNDYFLKRIVGKAFISRDQQPTSTNSPALLCGLGFFIARAAESEIAPDVPLGVPTPTSGIVTAEYGPLRDENATQPWIWRRTWVLGNQAWTGTFGTGTGGNANSFPQNTAHYGSIQDGGHIDAKTARRVAKEERLWLVFSARNYPINVAQTVSCMVYGYAELRMLGRMTKARNRGVF